MLDKLRHEILLARSRGTRQYEIARRAGLHPTVLSAILTGAVQVGPGDARIVRVAEVLGLTPAECFDESSSERKMFSEEGAPTAA
jgi:transcriptional regulator with XRE-family HTH domain